MAEQTYAEAVAELEAILVALEDDDVDVDRLAAQVARAAELIGWCRARLADARLEVEQVVAQLDRQAERSPSGGERRPSGGERDEGDDGDDPAP